MKTLWLFNTQAQRQALAAQHPEITYKSAYKTLVCEVLAQDLLAGQKAVKIVYPVVAGDEPLRFRLETYPLQALYPDCAISFLPAPCDLAETQGGVIYRLCFADGSEKRIFAPVRWKEKADGKRELAACAWQQDASGSFPIASDFEDFYDQACQILQDLPLKQLASGKCQIRFDITLQGEDEPLAVGEECLSLAEALHEEIYFSALEILQQRLGCRERRLRAGQILPVLRYGAQSHFACTISDNPPDYAESMEAATQLSPDCERAFCPHALAAEIDKLGAKRFDSQTLQGRQLLGALINPHLPTAFALSAGQHANESSGVVGALRAAKALAAAGDIAFSYRPLANPDGYAAFLHLCHFAPHHMHHGARYTASGCDLSYGNQAPALPEYTHSQTAKALLPQAWLHLNLHGYPAHEWTRPLSGYVPRHFARWTIPKGFFIIIRHLPNYHQQAQTLLTVMVKALLAYPAQIEQNREMLKNYLQAVGNMDFALAEGLIPYVIEEYEEMDYALEIITEAPDETISGEKFVIAQESQYRVVMAVADFLRQQDA